MSDNLTAAAETVDLARQRLLWVLGFVPDDKLTWSPAPTAHSALQIVGHVVASNAFFTAALTQGEVTQHPGDAEAIGSRDEAVAQLNAGTDVLIAAIRSLPDDKMEAVMPTPFGQISTPFILKMAGLHTFGHASQVEYLQACWGDTDFHWSG
ncbi:MAG: DinB family protein [Armatimonadetes bacterium]|nr:DinB family protein [Armatimonadota bacterium]